VAEAKPASRIRRYEALITGGLVMMVVNDVEMKQHKTVDGGSILVEVTENSTNRTKSR
jgi:hypothetical protein